MRYLFKFSWPFLYGVYANCCALAILTPEVSHFPWRVGPPDPTMLTVADGEVDPMRRYWPTAKHIRCGGSGRRGSSSGAEVVADREADPVRR